MAPVSRAQGFIAMVPLLLAGATWAEPRLEFNAIATLVIAGQSFILFADLRIVQQGGQLWRAGRNATRAT